MYENDRDAHRQHPQPCPSNYQGWNEHIFVKIYQKLDFREAKLYVFATFSHYQKIRKGTFAKVRKQTVPYQLYSWPTIQNCPSHCCLESKATQVRWPVQGRGQREIADFVLCVCECLIPKVTRHFFQQAGKETWRSGERET